MNTTATGGASRIHALTDGTAGRVHAYLLEDDDGLTLIDTLSADDGAEVLRALGRIGRGVTDLRRIVLTHAHRSHVRGAAWLKGASGATGVREPVRGVDHGGRAPVRPDRLLAAPAVPGLPPPGGPHPRLLRREGGQAATRFLSAPKCDTDVEVRHGDSVGSLQAVHTPGHTDGSM